MSINFEERVAQYLAAMSPAERRAVQYFQENREEVLIASAAALAEKAGTSDATVVRAAKALGFAGLDELRRTLADEIRASLSPVERLTRTLDEVGGSLSVAFEATLDIHLRSIEGLRRTITPALFAQVVDGILGARRVGLFGLGPSNAIASYLAIQLNRFGLEALTLAHTGLLFADDLRRLREGDLVIMFAYGRIYRELTALLDEVARLRLSSFLITDTLAAPLRRRVDLALQVARGHADMLSMHTGTLGFVEALLVGIAVKRPQPTMEALQALNNAREKLAGKLMAL
jgi:DNA-binding MurR/RpiR family transcriptional regulator